VHRGRDSEWCADRSGGKRRRERGGSGAGHDIGGLDGGLDNGVIDGVVRGIGDGVVAGGGHHPPPGDSTFAIEAFAVSAGSGPHDASPAVDGRGWFTAQDSDELGLRSEAGEARGEPAVAPALSKAGHGRTQIPRNLHTRSRVDPDETTKADFVEREDRRPWLLAHEKAELAKAIPWVEAPLQPPPPQRLEHARHEHERWDVALPGSSSRLLVAVPPGGADHPISEDSDATPL
jgi:hypothetical protein